MDAGGKSLKAGETMKVFKIPETCSMAASGMASWGLTY